MDVQEAAIRKRLRDDFPHYASRCLKIRTKDGKVQPFEINTVQRYAHERLERQKAETGKVRALILKGRQQGFSTYIGGRFYHRVTHNPGTQCFILTHEQPATDNLFGMVDRYHKHNNPLVKPSTGASNAKELYFDVLDSGYSVGTAGSKGVGRSKTIQLFHGSEAAFWPNASEHFAGVMQAVPDLPGTEIILESTANGVGGEFHDRWQQAEAGSGDYIAIFIPWFWSDEYRRPCPECFALSDEEQDYAALHGLNDAQMNWRRAKIIELKDPMLFMQEYPATAAEAFQSVGHDSFINTHDVLKARKRTIEGVGPLIIGADPSRFGDDAFAVARRKGRRVFKIERRYKLSAVEGANWLRQIIDDEEPERMFVDAGGIGGPVVDILQSWGAPYDKIVVGVDFGAAPQRPPRIGDGGNALPGPLNRRSEMWSDSRDWLTDETGADIPDDDALHADACAPGYRYNMHQKLLLESKEDIRKRGLRSPDGWDSVVLTFSSPVKEKPKQERYRKGYGHKRQQSSTWGA